MTHIEQRIDTAANWTLGNPVLYPGEVGWEKDTRQSKVGDGVTAWNDLLYTVSDLIVTKTDVGLSEVDNTSDMDKPVSTAQAAAFAPKDSPAFTGNPTAPTPSPSDDDTSIATTGYVHDVLDPALSATSLPAYTSGTRPPHREGLAIYETNTDSIMVSDGTVWNRVWRKIGEPYFKGVVPDATNLAANTTVNWTAVEDSDGTYINGEWYAPRSGKYRVSVQFKWGATPPSTAPNVKIYVGAVAVAMSPNFSNSPAYGGFSFSWRGHVEQSTRIFVQIGQGPFITQDDNMDNNFCTIEWVRP